MNSVVKNKRFELYLNKQLNKFMFNFLKAMCLIASPKFGENQKDEDFQYDKFQNGKQFNKWVRKTRFKCTRCGGDLIEVKRRKQKYAKVTPIYGFFCIKCDEKVLGMVEWKVKVN